MFSPLRHRRPGRILKTGLVLSVSLGLALTAPLLLAACRPAGSTAVVRSSESLPGGWTLPAEAGTLQAIAAGGNLHYHQFLVTDGSQVFWTNAEGHLCRSLANGLESAVLAEVVASNLCLTSDGLFYTAGQYQGPILWAPRDQPEPDTAGESEADQTAETDQTAEPNQAAEPGTASPDVLYSYLITSGDRLLAISEPDAQLVSVARDGSSPEILVFQPVTEIIRDERGVCYLAGQQAANGIMRYDPATRALSTLLHVQASSLNSAGDYLYYCDPLQDQQLFAIKKDQAASAGELVLAKAVEKPFVIQDGYLYLIDTDSQNCLLRLPLPSVSSFGRINPLHIERAKTVVADAVESFVVIGESVYYRRAGGTRLYRTGVSGGPVTRIN